MKKIDYKKELKTFYKASAKKVENHNQAAHVIKDAFYLRQ